MSQAKRTKLKVIYKDQDISHDITDFSYTDNYDQTDDLHITLSDREMQYINDLFPETGDTLQVSIEVYDWNHRGDNRKINLGIFEIDDIGYIGAVSIGATAIPITGNGRSEKKHKTWKKISLSTIARDISKNAGVPLVYDTNIDPFYDIAAQVDKSDIEYLEELCKSDGLCLKVTDGQLIVFDESKYESELEIATITRGVSNIIGEPRFNRRAKDIYKACEVSHFDPKTDRLYTGYFEVPNAPNVGHVLTLREPFNSVGDDMSLDRKARARCREKNRNEWTCNLTMKGDIIYFSGSNIRFEGWGRFDGKYHITNATYTTGKGGSTTILRTRRCLEGY